MKKFLSMLTFAAMVMSFAACDEDDDGTKFSNPEIVAVGESISEMPGETAEISLSVSAEAGIKTLTVSGAATGDVTFDGDDTNQVVSYPFTVPANAAEGTEYDFTFTLTDKKNKTATANVTVTASETPSKTITIVTGDGGVEDMKTTDPANWDAASKTYTLKGNNTYILEGFVFVNDGQIIKIEPGTVIKGKPGQGSGASALIIARGGKIMAEGTAANPIIFTGVADDLAGSIADDETALWGGLIILGKATNNNNHTSNVVNIEGIPTEEERGSHGGNDDADNSGVLRYVSVRHGGSVIGADNEINGITFGSVGSGTVVENVEVFSNFDDGIEFFGGTVNVKNFLISYCGDDGIDIDLGYRGNLQNGIVWTKSDLLQSSDPCAAELDGGDGNSEEAEPFATPKLANITFLFEDADAGNKNLNRALYFRDNYRGSLLNSIVVGHDGQLDIERLTSLDESSYVGFGTDYTIEGNIFYSVNGVVDGTSFADVFNLSGNGDDATLESEVETMLASVNAIANPELGSGSDRFKPSGAIVKENIAALPEGSTLEVTLYKGAVDPDQATPWYANWSKLYAVSSAE